MFLSGQENAHSVRPVTEGQRCALTLSFTEKTQDEQEANPSVESLLELLYPASSTLGEPEQIPGPEHDRESPEQQERAHKETQRARDGRQRQYKRPQPMTGAESPALRDEL
ncbi:prolyl 3-hydroxylase 1-like [Stegostoma tigrinum]|uniref:prolyl 3-hydroxylase 1-like n=1 Tax=Stegostoma tigrinum TaxID=3053191 RepID=UPI00286FD18A|nr:prolyl 3-hydroxylase 1-like [Stegostoma tigrinum]